MKVPISQFENDLSHLHDQVNDIQVNISSWRARSHQHSSQVGRLVRALEVSNILNRSFLDENRISLEGNRGLKENMLSFDDAYYRTPLDRRLLEDSLQFQKNVVNDLALKLRNYQVKEMNFVRVEIKIWRI